MSWFIIKNEALLETTENLFSNSKSNITTEGKRHLVSAVGSKKFRKKYVNQKVNKWCMKKAAYEAFCFGEKNNYSYFLRTISVMRELI